MEIYISINGQNHGPYPIDEVKSYVMRGDVKLTDLAWRNGCSEWVPLNNFPEFSGAVPTALTGKGKRLRRAFYALTAIFVLMLAGSILFWAVSLKKKSSTSLALARRANTGGETPQKPGLPQNLEELNRWYSEPAGGKNAAVFYLSAINTMYVTDAEKASSNLIWVGKAKLPASDRALSSAFMKEAATLIQRVQPCLIEFDKGNQYVESRYPVDFSQGPDAPLPHLKNMKTAASLFGLGAVWNAELDRGDEAADYVQRMLFLARSLNNEPSLVSQFLRVAVGARALNSLERVLNRTALSQEKLGLLETTVAAASQNDSQGASITTALVGEHLISRSLTQSSPDRIKKFVTSIYPDSANGRFLNEGLNNLDADRDYLDDTYHKASAMRELPFPERLRLDDFLHRRGLDAIRQLYPVSGTCQLRDVAVKEASILTSWRLIQGALALERFRLDHQMNYPDNVKELLPKYLSEVPLDPFTGGPLKYTKFADGYSLESIGSATAKVGGKQLSHSINFTVHAPRGSS
jgi:hypothetical protein